MVMACDDMWLQSTEVAQSWISTLTNWQGAVTWNESETFWNRNTTTVPCMKFFYVFLVFSSFFFLSFGFPILNTLPRIFLLCHNLYFSTWGRFQLPQGFSVFFGTEHAHRFKNHLEVFHQLTMLLDALWCSFQTSKYHKWKQTSHFAPSPTTETEGWNIEKKRIAPLPFPAAPLSFFSLKDWPGLPVDMKKVWNQSDPANKLT